MKVATDNARRPSPSTVAPPPAAAPGNIDDRTKIAVDTLYKEFQRIQVKSVATDDWFFRFLSIAVVPFVAFLGYAAITPQYRILVAALPALSLVGLLVVCVLSSHYAYATVYGDYLQREINRLLGSEVLHDTTFGRAAYNARFTPVNVSYGIGIALLVAVNVLAAPFITQVVAVFYERRRETLGWAGVVLQHYWMLNIVLLGTTILAGTSLVLTQRRLRALATALSLDQGVERAMPPDSGAGPGKPSTPSVWTNPDGDNKATKTVGPRAKPVKPIKQSKRAPLK
jgi:hypothetical protein